MFRLAYFVTHPIQYQAPLLRHLASAGELDLRVFFYSDFSLREHHEPDFGTSFKYDTELVADYHHELLPRLFIGPSARLRSAWPANGLRQLLREGGFDAIWVHGWGHVCSWQAISAAGALGIPVFLRGETTPPAERKFRLKGLVRDFLLRWLFRRVAGFLCIGSLNRKFYQQYGVADSRLFHMPYAVDNAWFQERCRVAASQREALRQELGLESGRPVILFAAKFIPAKAPGDLLAAFQRLQRRCKGPKPYLLFVGDGPLRSQLETQAGACPDRDVRFLGFRNQTELPALYDLCDVFVAPSHFEPWGLVVNEVMNAGRAVIVSDRVGAAPDLVQSGINGWIYPHGDVPALASCLSVACDDADLPGMGQRSLERIDSWNFETDQNGLLAALESVCQRVRRVPDLARR
jgi:glycosyltransferase involved in cell wall biosynthesis